jgi:hypothetical protein
MAPIAVRPGLLWDVADLKAVGKNEWLSTSCPLVSARDGKRVCGGPMGT